MSETTPPPQEPEVLKRAVPDDLDMLTEYIHANLLFPERLPLDIVQKVFVLLGCDFQYAEWLAMPPEIR